MHIHAGTLLLVNIFVLELGFVLSLVLVSTPLVASKKVLKKLLLLLGGLLQSLMKNLERIHSLGLCDATGTGQALGQLENGLRLGLRGGTGTH